MASSSRNLQPQLVDASLGAARIASCPKVTVVVGLHEFTWELFLSFQSLITSEYNPDFQTVNLIALPESRNSKLRNVDIEFFRLLTSCGYQDVVSRCLARNSQKQRLLRNQLRNFDSTSGKISRDDPEILDLGARETIELLYLTRRYHCADPRDHVFALRGLLTAREILAEADYTAATKAVYARFTRKFISIYQSTNILRLAGLTWRGLNSSDDLGPCPSWIPYLGTIDDFEFVDEVYKPLWVPVVSLHHTAAKGLGRARENRVGENDEQLSIFGYAVDVLDILQPFFVKVGNMSCEDWIRSVWRELTPNLPLSYPTGCDPKHALLRVLIGNTNVVPKDLKTAERPCQEWVSDAIAWIEKEGRPDEQRELEILIDNQHSPMAPSSMVSAPRTPENTRLDPIWSSRIVAYLYTSITGVTSSRKFLRTQNGFMGLAPQLVEVGDELWVLLGCDVPMILRKCDDYYILVGECFVYGMMEGEQTKDLLASGPLKNITLH